MTARLLYVGMLTTLIALIVLGLLVELWLAPLRPHGSLLALKVVPLVLALWGVARRRIYTMQWSSMLILLYFAGGLISATSGRGASAFWGAVEALLAALFFACALAYVHPFKRRARLAQQSLAHASAHSSDLK